MFNGWETWIDILWISLIIYLLYKPYSIYRAKKIEEQKRKAMNPVEFSNWLEEVKRQEEEAKAEKVKKYMQEIEKLNNLPVNKNDIFGHLSLQKDGSIIVYNKYFFDEDTREICISYTTFNTSEGYHNYIAKDKLEWNRMTKDRQRFINFKKELEHFGFTIEKIKSE